MALRLQQDDFESFKLIEDDIRAIVDLGDGLFDRWTLIIDNRFCMNVNAPDRVLQLAGLIRRCHEVFGFEQIIVTGSSIPASISEILKVNAALTHSRVELGIYRGVKKLLPDLPLILGDYTIVSPLYSDAAIPKEAMQNVITAKVTYSFGDAHYLARGGAIKTHPRGPLQYNDIALHIVGSPFYRGAPYSFGDLFLEDKSKFIGKNITANTILKPTINLHMTYMLKDFAA